MKKIDLSFKIGGFTVEFLLTKKLSKKVLDFASCNRNVIFDENVIALCAKLKPIKSDSMWAKYVLVDNFEKLINLNLYRLKNPAIQIPVNSQRSSLSCIESARYNISEQTPCIFNSKIKMGY